MKQLTTAAVLLVLCTAGIRAEGPGPGQGFVDVPGGPVWYNVAGNGPGIPLLVLHGGPGGTSCGFTLLEPLGDQRPIVRYDQLGTGRSGRPDDLSLWTVEHFVEELHVLRTELGLDQMHLLGHSCALPVTATPRNNKKAKHDLSIFIFISSRLQLNRENSRESSCTLAVFWIALRVPRP